MADKIIDISGARAARDGKLDEARRLIAVGGLVDETRVSLCIYGDDLEPDEVTRVLGTVPTNAHRKGERIPSRSSRARRSGTHRTGAWILRVIGQAAQDPEEVTATLLDQLPADETVWAELAGRYCVRLNYGLFMEAWNRGFTLSPGLVTRIARMRLEMGFDIYADLEV